MIQIHDTKERDLDKIAEEHYKHLEPIVRNTIRKHIVKSQQAYLLKNLETILRGKPDRLAHCVENYKKYCRRNKTVFNKGISHAFSYENFLDRKSYNIYHLAKKLNVNVCPYCNRQYTFTVLVPGKNITRPEFDHFFSQEKFPLLALSFYNLIPSCVICNSRLKGRIEFDLTHFIHPYINGFNADLQFNYNPLTANAALGMTDDLEIKLNINAAALNAAKIRNNCRVFRLAEIFQEHADSVREIIRKHYVSGGDYLNILAKTFPGLNTSQEELYQMAFGNYYSDTKFEKRPLGKLNKDIFEQLKFTL